MRHRTPAERQRQAQLIKQWQPWQHSTGARTIEGKAVASGNAFKGGFRQALKTLRQMLRNQQISINEL